MGFFDRLFKRKDGSEGSTGTEAQQGDFVMNKEAVKMILGESADGLSDDQKLAAAAMVMMKLPGTQENVAKVDEGRFVVTRLKGGGVSVRFLD
ncbi:MAG: hypothetical protein PF636_01165 [Actinomycetota bacterium]|jgi:hypothetical protein|nr:hypothetical protein [Actinomycetota bacterium]